MISFSPRRRHTSLIGLTCSLLFLLASCTSMKTTEETIESRAMARWDALLSGDVAAAYEYLAPGYRSSVSFAQYQRTIMQNKVKWTKAGYIESSCEETTCNVKILLDFTVYGALRGVQSFDGSDQVEESWVKSDDKWYLVP